MGPILRRGVCRRRSLGPAQVSQNPCRQIVHWRNDIRQARVDRASRHSVKLGRRRILNQDQPALFLDAPKSQRPIGPHAGKNHTNTQGLLILGQRSQEKINWETQPACGGRGEQMEYPVEYRHVLVGRNDIDTVRHHPSAILDLDHFHCGRTLQQLRHDAFARGIQVLHDHEGNPAILRHVAEEAVQGFQSTCG